MFSKVFFHNIKYMGVIWILGISIIGLPVMLILLFLKGMVIGFTVGFLVNQMGWSGFLLSFVSVLPQNIFIIPVFLSVMQLLLCHFLLKHDAGSIFLNKSRNRFTPPYYAIAVPLVAIDMFVACAAEQLKLIYHLLLMKSVMSSIK